MTKKIKTIAKLLLVAATVFSFASCGEKEEVVDNNNNTTTTQTSDDSAQIANTYWRYENEDDQVFVVVRFMEKKEVRVNKTYLVDGLMTQDIYEGTYTYSAGNGKMKLYYDLSTSFSSFEAPFKINGNVMTFTLRGENFTLTQYEY